LQIVFGSSGFSIIHSNYRRFIIDGGGAGIPPGTPRMHGPRRRGCLGLLYLHPKQSHAEFDLRFIYLAIFGVKRA